MRWIRLRKRFGSRSGQSLIETALLLPLVLLAVLNAINFGYYFVVALHLASAPREGVQYAVQGFVTPGSATLPNPGPVSDLAYHDMINLSGSASATVQVCSEVNGLNNPGTVNQTAKCVAYTSDGGASSAGSATPAHDPESPLFVLQRVDVTYTVTPLIGAMSLKVGGIDFGMLTPGLTFHRQVSMRAIN
jgi:Flp pilus assembly protein TadG